ncbi:MAG: penicillin-binding protein 2 [Kofleriaceae bacterium]|nr:penicillin-binding protein 2 [Myxococcales bacterium]MCB9563482.1 penicillin-binding protein 2 [Kofleriaceae bacterium]MCB9574752.1 penicillin-binding protein 2 [Kofleriaceae bacterium]
MLMPTGSGGSGGGGPSGGVAIPELGRRLRWVALAMILAFCGLIGRLWQLQVVRGDRYYERTVSNVVHERFLPSIRGKIVDRNGVPLADNRPAFNIYVTPKEFGDHQAELDRLLGLSEEESAKVTERLAAGQKRNPRQAVMVLEDQGEDRAALVQQARFRLAGVEVRHEPYRHYPQGELAAHLVGYMTQMNERELDRLAPLGYDASELIGRYGLEYEFENYLRGKKGIERFAVDARGQRIDDEAAAGLIQGERLIEPVAGYNVVSTIDARLQRLAERAVAPHRAAAVAVVEVKTGRILALVSKPSFDPNVMTGHLTRAEEALLNSDPRKPFTDKTLAARYPPGSTYKFVTAIAALEDGLGAEDEQIDCKGAIEVSGTRFRCTAAHGKLDMIGAIQHSCNVYFWQLAQRIGMDRMAAVAEAYGFGRPTQLGLNGDSGGRVPTKAWYEQHGRHRIGDTINAATGQGDVEVTVLQMTMAYAALANGGTRYVPQVVDRVEAADGHVVVQYEPRVAAEIGTPPEVLDVLHRGMWKVVNERGGTAFDHAHSDVVEFAGKTGTAEVRTRKNKDKPKVELEGWHPSRSHAWFAGYAPATDPEIAIVVLIEHGGPGGRVAGPVARQILEGWWTKIRNNPGGGDAP